MLDQNDFVISPSIRTAVGEDDDDDSTVEDDGDNTSTRWATY
jgi:hypothetical protein